MKNKATGQKIENEELYIEILINKAIVQINHYRDFSSSY